MVSHAFHSALMEPMLEAFADEISQLSFTVPRAGSGPVWISDSDGRAADDRVRSPGYWVRHAREAVRFADGVGALISAGVRRFAVLGPDGGLTGLIDQNVDQNIDQGLDPAGRGEADAAPVVVAALRKNGSESATLLSAMAELFVAGVPMDPRAVFGADRGRRVDLPTYAFQHERFWLQDFSGPRNVAGVGQQSAEHPLFGAVVMLPDAEGVLLTGRLSIRDQPWLVDHTVFGRVLVPGTAFAELMLCAGDWVGCEVLGELVLNAPLALPERGGVQVRVSVGAADEQGRHKVRIHSRAEDAPLDANWALHAAGTLAPAEPMGDVPSGGLDVWPPQDAEAVDPEELYERMAAAGLEYGPGFRAVRSVWQRDAEIFGEVRLDDELAQSADRFGLHPALFDAALHPLWLLRQGSELPFAYSGVRLHASGALTLRVRITDKDGSVSLTAVDGAGQPVLTAESVVTRPAQQGQTAEADDSAAGVLTEVAWVDESAAGSVPPQRGGAAGSARVAVLGAAAAAAGLFGEVPAGERRIHPDWESLTADLDGGWIPDVVITLCDVDSPAREGLVAAVRSTTERMLATIQRWLREERVENAQLILVTRHALEGDDAELVGAPSWGLVRSAQSEHPGRFVLIDLDQTASATLIARAVTAARAGDEPQLVIRHGEVRVPRLVRVERRPAQTRDRADEFGQTWLITGGTGALGRAVAQHLVLQHGADDLVLLSRHGTAADWIAQLPASVTVRVVSCDVADRADLDRVLAGLAAQGRRLAGVVHAAGTLDDGVIQSLDRERLDAVMRPKVDGAWNLHEATLEMDLSQFVLFSSAASVFGGAGQGNYAAANAFLEALAQYRHTRGLPATSIAWGLWEQDAGMAGRLSTDDRARMRRTGLLPLPASTGLRVFDLARSGDRPAVVAAPIDAAALRIRAELPALFRALIRPARRAAGAEESGGALREQLIGLPVAEQGRMMLDLVRSEAAAVLGRSRPDEIGADRTFSELGFDSLTAVELRNRLNARTGQRLAATVVFDYPASSVLAGFLLTRLTGGSAAPGPGAGSDDREPTIRRMLTDLSYDELRQLGIVDLLANHTEGKPDAADEPGESGIEEMDVDELIQFVDGA